MYVHAWVRSIVYHLHTCILERVCTHTMYMYVCIRKLGCHICVSTNMHSRPTLHTQTHARTCRHMYTYMYTTCVCVYTCIHTQSLHYTSSHTYGNKCELFCMRIYTCLHDIPAVKSAVHLLQIQEVHPVPHSIACNFCHFHLFFFIPVPSRSSCTSKTPEDKATLLLSSHSSPLNHRHPWGPRWIFFVHAIRKRLKKCLVQNMVRFCSPRWIPMIQAPLSCSTIWDWNQGFASSGSRVTR